MMHRGLGWLGVLLVALLYAAPALAKDTVYFYYTDTLHSTVVETDDKGNVLERTTYAPYGQVLNRALRDGPGYTGHEEDPATGLVYMQQRYYDPQSGRFISTDPVQMTANGGNFNRYWYANDNPYRYTDPDGRDILVIAGGRNTGSINFFGHIASSVQGFGVASYGNATALGSSTTKYILNQSASRNQVVILIPTTPAQDTKAVKFIQAKQNQNTATLLDNCAVKTNLIINAAGVATDDVPFPGGTSRDISTLPGATTWYIPRNGKIPQSLQKILPNFDPQPPPPPPPPPRPLPRRHAPPTSDQPG